MTSPHLRIAALFALAALTACGRASTPAVFNGQVAHTSQWQTARTQVPTPAVFSMNLNSGALEYWELTSKGGSHPQTLIQSPGFSANAMASDKRLLLIASPIPAQVILLDVDTAKQTTLTDTYGIPLDIAIDKGENIYVANSNISKADVTEYPQASRQKPNDVICNGLSGGQGITVDDDGHVYLVANGPLGATGIYRVPHGTSGQQYKTCSHLNIPVPNGVQGLYVDPATGDMLVMDDPSQCAGGSEGRVRIYSAPYGQAKPQVVTLGGNCPTSLGMNAASNVLFDSDSDVSGTTTFIRQYAYPSGKLTGIYTNGNAGAFATIPSTLPN